MVKGENRRVKQKNRLADSGKPGRRYPGFVLWGNAVPSTGTRRHASLRNGGPEGQVGEWQYHL